MPIVVILMAESSAAAFLDRELPPGAVRLVVESAGKRHHGRRLAAAADQALTAGHDVVVGATSRSLRRAVVAVAAKHDARVIGYWARPADVGMPWRLDLEPEHTRLSRRPRRSEGFDELYEVLNPGPDHRLNPL